MRLWLCLAVVVLLAVGLEGRRGGGGRSSSSSGSSWGRSRSSSSSSSSRSSWFSRSRSRVTSAPYRPPSSSGSSSSRSSYGSGSKSPSYPKQQWGTSGGNTAGATPFGAKPAAASNPAIGGGGFAKPAGAAGTAGAIGGGGFANPSGVKPAIGGGGFVNPSGSSSAIGGGGFAKPSAPSLGTINSGSKVGGFGSHAAAGGLGAAGGYAAGKYSYPKPSAFSSVFKKKPKSFASPGYGTAWGTNFNAANQYKQKKGFSKKALGLGVAAGFVGGAAIGVAGTMATYSVYHRYNEYKNMMRMRGFGYGGDDDDGGFFGPDYHRDYYNGNQCFGGCLGDSHCEYGICECNYGFERRYGRCNRVGAAYTPRPQSFDPFVSCANNAGCQAIDLNMVCNTKLTTAEGGKCQCKPDMRWNKEGGECQMFIDVDCSAITYDTPPSKLITDAVAKAQAGGITPPSNEESPNLTRTPTIDESIGSSLLSQVDSAKATEAELREAYCRDVDSFSFDFNVDDGKPPRCDSVPRTACGVVHDSGSCNGGWRLIITTGEISFPYFSSYWKYRNDIDLIGVKAGCTLTAFSSTGFSGQRGTFRADANDRWWRLNEYAEFLHLHEDIESIQCVCRSL